MTLDIESIDTTSKAWQLVNITKQKTIFTVERTIKAACTIRFRLRKYADPVQIIRVAGRGGNVANYLNTALLLSDLKPDPV